MKDIRRFNFGLCFLAITIMTSCLKEEIVAIMPDSIESETIAFNAVVDWGEYADVDTKGAPASNGNRLGNMTLSSNDSSATLPVGVYVKDGIHTIETGPATKGSKITSSDINSFIVWATLKGTDQTTLFFPAEGELFEPDDNAVYHSDPAYFWPGAGTLDFVAVANAPASGFTAKINEAGTQLESFSYTVPTDATQQNDIVVATLSAEGSSNTSQPLHFEHIMSAVNFKIGETMAQGAIKSIKINNIYSSGVYNVGSKTWTTNSNAKTSYSAVFITTDANGNYEPNDKVAETIINDNQATFMMIPQVLDADAEIVVEFLYDNASEVKELRGNIALKGDGTSNYEWKKSTTTYYELSIDENYNLTITPRGDVLDAHYVMTDITVNVDTETNQNWTLKVEATNIEGDDVSIALKDDLNPLIKTDGYWINNIVEGSTTTSARGTKEIKGTTKGQHIITVFIPENITAAERKITLTLSLDSDPTKARKTEYLYQMCPYWDTNKRFGWEKVQNSETGQYGFNWTLVECYIFTYKCEGTGILRYNVDSAKKLVTDLMGVYGLPTTDADGNDTTAPGYGGFVTIDTFSHYQYYENWSVDACLLWDWNGAGFYPKGTRIAVIIDYTKLNFDDMMSENDGLANTKGFFAASSLLQFQDALHNMQKVNESGNAFRHLSDAEYSSGKFLFNNYSRWDGSNAMFQNNSGSTDDASGILQYVIRRNAFNLVTRTTSDGENTYTSLDMNPNNIKWYLPSVRQFDDAVLNWATGNTTFTPANFWSSTAAVNNQAYAGGTTTPEPRENRHQVVVQRVNTNNVSATATVDNTSLAGGENGDTNQWLQ